MAARVLAEAPLLWTDIYLTDRIGFSRPRATRRLYEYFAPTGGRLEQTAVSATRFRSG